MSWDAKFHDRYRQWCRERQLDPHNTDSAAQYLFTKKGQRIRSVDNNVLALKNLGLDTTAPAVRDALRQCHAEAPDRPVSRRRANMTWDASFHARYCDWCRERQLDPHNTDSAAQYLLTKKGQRIGSVDNNVRALKIFGLDTTVPAVRDAIRQCHTDAPDRPVSSSARKQTLSVTRARPPESNARKRRRRTDTRLTATQAAVTQTKQQIQTAVQDITRIGDTLDKMARHQELDDKQFLFGKQRGICSLCFSEKPFNDLETDHKIPISRGGNDDLDNLQLLCRWCNARKGGRTMEEMKAKDPAHRSE